MIKKQIHKIKFGKPVLYKTFSTDKVYIKQVETGRMYEHAIDVADAPYTYEETDIPLPVREKKSVVKETIK